MYYCVITEKMSQPGEKLNKVVVATRPRSYTKFVKNEETRKWEEVYAADGWEVVKEISVSDEGLAVWEAWSQADRDLFVKSL